MDFRNMMDFMYQNILVDYLKERSEEALYQGQKFSRKTMEYQISPEEIISLHKNAMIELYPDLPEHVLHSFDILLEVMLGYGLAYQEHQSLRNMQKELKTEMEIAANVQQTLLGTNIPEVEGLDIGVISVPAKHMNGDYYHFVHDESNRLSVAIADVIGKGIPAALCMSMIKYAMDSLPENGSVPHIVLENLNRVVEQNVDPSMFITMFYGMYNQSKDMFYYASAGHEPGLFYDVQRNEFSELKAKGLMLGVEKKTKYHQYSKRLNPGDMIILMSDGVTECRTDDGFLDKETLHSFLHKYIHLSAQEMVTKVYKEIERIQDFQLSDDFTMIVLRKKGLF
jgi:phosphoserine phosphatase RsbU/P